MRLSGIDQLNLTINDMYKFEDELHQLSLKIYPSDALRELLIGELVPTINELRDILLTEMKQLRINSTHLISAKAKAVNKIWWQNLIQMVANAISSTDIKSHPLEIMNVFREMIKNIDGGHFEIITSPVDALNFTFREIWVIVKSIIENEVGIVRTTDKKFIELTFPKKHKDNVFLGGIYAHEIGHYFDRNRKIWAKIYTQVVHNNNKIKLLKSFAVKGNGLPVSDAELLFVLEQYILGSWIREAVADCVAVYLLGPAFIFSTNELLLSIVGPYLIEHSHLIDSASNTHPRDGLRNKLQMETLHSLGLYEPLGDTLQQVLKNISDDWNTSRILYPENIIGNNQYRLLLNQDSYQILEQIWTECLPLVHFEVSNLIGKNVIKVQHIEESHRLAEERLKWLVPPNELDGRAASSQAIINSGWFAKCLYKEEISSLVSRLNGDRSDYEFTDIINGLLRYALHAAIIQGRWNA